MKGFAAHNTTLTSANKLGLLTFSQSLPCSTYIFKSPTVPISVGWRRISKLNMPLLTIRAQSSDVGSGSKGNEKKEVETEVYTSGRTGDSLSINGKQPDQLRYALSVASVLIGTGLIFSLIAFAKGGPSSILDVIAKSGFTAAFSLILVSEIGDKTFFIAALLAMQYKKGLVLLGSMAALSLMTILSVVIGRIFHSVPAQFQTTLPIGEYAAVTLLLFFGLKSIKDAWELPSQGEKRDVKSNTGLDEYAEAEELVKEKASARNSLEIIWKSFSLVFFAEWGDRSMLATIALGAAQSPWGVASGAIGGHLVATLVAILGGAFFANYISEKLVGYIGGTLFLVFAVATFFGVF